jgi:predicted acetyltransferase
VTVQTAGARLAPEVPSPSGRMLLLEPKAAIPRIAALYDRLRRERVGHLDRAGAWWKRRVRDSERLRDGRSALRAAVHESDDGAVAGYVLYAVKGGWDDGPDGRAHIRELIADGPGATAALRAYRRGIDLPGPVEWHVAPSDEPLAELVAGPRNARFEMGPNVWIRLVDVRTALAAG